MFRFNRRHAANRGVLFWRLVCELMDRGPVTRYDLASRKLDVAAADAAHFAEWEKFDADRRKELARRQYQRTKAKVAAARSAGATDAVDEPF